MAAVPTANDVLMLSQTASIVGGVFRSGSGILPQEFLEVDREMQGLANALKLLAHTLEATDKFYALAHDEIQEGMSTILASAQVTLHDLQSFVERYSEVHIENHLGGMRVEKEWRNSALEKYRAISWTRDSGDMLALRGLLIMHCSTISTLTVALQSKSLFKLEQIVPPLAEKLEDIHDAIPDHLIESLEDLHNLSFTLEKRIQQTPHKTLIEVNKPPTPEPSDVDQSDTIATLAALALEKAPPIPPKSYVRRRNALCEFTDTPPDTEAQSPSIDGMIADSALSSPFYQIDQKSAPHSPDQAQTESAELYRNRSKSLPHVSHGLMAEDDDEERARKLKWAPFVVPDLDTRSIVEQPVPTRPLSQKPLANVPLFATKPTLAIPSSNGRSTPESENPHDAFMSALFKDAVIMFDGPATLYQATVDNDSTNDWRDQHTTSHLSKTSRVCVIRRKEWEPTGAEVYTTSIWTISSDFRKRIQQRLPSTIEITPFASFFDREKVSLTTPCRLLHHGPIWGSRVTQTLTAHWTSFTFSTADVATTFQSALFGRPLLDSFQTEKTTLLHPSILRNKLAYEEQVAGMERLRLWYESGDVGPGTTGGVMAMMHLSPNFGEGWIRWWVNSARVARYKKRGSRSVDISGLDVAVARPGLGKMVDSSVGGGTSPNSPNSPSDGFANLGGPREGVSQVVPFEMQRRDSLGTLGSTASAKRDRRNARIKMVHGLRITFVSELERGRFLVQVEEARRRMLPLPDF